MVRSRPWIGELSVEILRDNPSIADRVKELKGKSYPLLSCSLLFGTQEWTEWLVLIVCQK